MSKSTGRTVSIPAVRTVAYGLSLLGVAPGPILEAANIAPELFFDNDARVAAEKMTSLWQAAENASESFGLQCSLAITPLRDTLLGYLLRSSPTLLEGLQLLGRYQTLLQDASLLEIEFGPTAARIVQRDADPSLPISRAAMEWGFASAVRFASEGIGRQVFPDAVTFRHGRPHDLTLHHQIFGENVTFDAEHNSLVLSNALLGERLTTVDESLAKVLDRRAAEVLESLPSNHDIVNKVRATAEPMLRDGDATLAKVAKKLGLSGRSLQRRLSEVDTSFADIVDNLRKDLARAHVLDPSLSLAQVAFLLGFSDQTTFHRAFVRWTGQAPGVFRTERQSA